MSIYTEPEGSQSVLFLILCKMSLCCNSVCLTSAKLAIRLCRPTCFSRGQLAELWWWGGGDLLLNSPWSQSCFFFTFYCKVGRSSVVKQQPRNVPAMVLEPSQRTCKLPRGLRSPSLSYSRVLPSLCLRTMRSLTGHVCIVKGQQCMHWL